MYLLYDRKYNNNNNNIIFYLVPCMYLPELLSCHIGELRKSNFIGKVRFSEYHA